MTVLIVDDDRTIQRIHKVLLKKFGVESQVVENGREAINLLSGEVDIELILMDLNMPVMNGLEATMALRAMGVKSMIVGISASGQSADRDAFIAAGAKCCYIKPLTFDKVATILQHLNN